MGTSITSFIRSTVGKRYYNDFTTTDNTTKFGTTWALVTGAAGTASYISGTSGSGNKIQACANTSNTSGAVFTNLLVNSTSLGTVGNGLVGRLTDGSNFYVLSLGNVLDTNLKIQKIVATVLTNLTSVAKGTISINTWYDTQFSVSGQTLLGSVNIGGTITNTTTTDVALTTGNYFGVECTNIAAVLTKFNYLLATNNTIITINGLLDGQKFNIYQGTSLVGTSGASANGAAILNIIGLYPNPPYDKITITDTDGSTLIYTNTNTANIYPGDVYTVTATPSLALNPPAPTPRIQSPRIFFSTGNRTYNKIVSGEINPSSANTLGLFRLVILDPNRDEEKNFGNYEKIRIYGKFGGASGLILRGVVERLMPVRLKGGMWGLEVSGRDYGAYASKRANAVSTTYTNREISDIFKNTTDGLNLYVPEIVFGNYIQFTNTTLTNWTYFAGRPIWDAMKELAVLASKATGSNQWGVYNCLTPDSLVLRGDEWIRADEFTHNNISSMNRFNCNIIRPMKRQYDGYVYEIKPGYLPSTTLTPEHPVRTKNRGWIDAKDIKIDDYLVFPKYKPKILSTITDEEAELLGWYVAEGSMGKIHSKFNKSYQMSFCLNKKEIKEANRISELINNIFNIKSRIYESRTSLVVSACGVKLTEWLYNHALSLSWKKRIPQAILDAPIEQIRVFLKAYSDGDGYHRYKGDSVRITTVSLRIVSGLTVLLSRFGMVPYVYKRRDYTNSTIEGRHINIRPSYEIGVPLWFIEGRQESKKANHNKRYLSDKLHIYLPIRWIKKKNYSGLVYNWETEDNTYITTFGVHNCSGQHAGEYGKPNVHLSPISNQVNLIPIDTLKTFRTLGPKDWRQIVTQTRIRYSIDGTLNNLAFVTVNGIGPGQNSNFALSFDGTTSNAKILNQPGLIIS